MIYILFLITIFICLFILYEFSKNDFVLLRRNISLTQMFDYTFITLVIGFLVSRLIYILNTHNFLYLKPINFLHVFQLPGLSILGFFLGCIGMLFVILRNRKVLQRVYDIFLVSFFPLFLVSLLYSSVPRTHFYVPLIVGIISMAIFAFSVVSIRNYTLKDGSISLLLISTIALASVTFPFFTQRVAVFQGLSLLQIASIVIVIACMIYFLVNQQIISFRKR